MKFTKNKVFVAALAICLIAILSMGSLAWFNANDEVTNTFKVADSTTDNDTAPDFSIMVDETSNIIDSSGPQRTEDGNTYENILPGDKLAKDPTVTNTSTTYKQYIRVNVIISKAFADQVAEAQGTTANTLDFSRLFDGFDATKYEATRVVDSTTLTDYYIYAYYVNGKINAGDSFTVFTKVNIPNNFVQSDMAYGTFNINVKAEAVQTENLGDGVDTASEAFAAVNWEVGTDYNYPATETSSNTSSSN